MLCFPTAFFFLKENTEVLNPETWVCFFLCSYKRALSCHCVKNPISITGQSETMSRGWFRFCITCTVSSVNLFSTSYPFCTFLQVRSINPTSVRLLAGEHTHKRHTRTHTFISSFQHAKGPAVTNDAGNDLCAGGCAGGCWLEDREWWR